MTERKKCLIFCLLLATLLSGCAGKGADGAAGAKQEEASRENVSQVAEKEQESIQESTAQAVEEEQKEQEKQEKENVQSGIVFEAQDMEGNIVSSDVLSEARLTMINVWATYCNPCLSEMPELGELAGEYETGEFQLIGIVSDVIEGGDQKQIEEAQSLIEMTGADYTHLLLNKSLYDALLTDVTGVPTTFFFDQDGNLLGSVLGAAKKEVWKERIDGLLEKLQGAE